MNEQEFNKFMESFETLINDRINIAISKVSKTKKYKERHSLYNKLYKQILKNSSINELEEFENSIYSVNYLENNYIYLQGFIDGILLREQLGHK